MDSTGVREGIKGHNFRVRDQSPWYDVNVLFPLLARMQVVQVGRFQVKKGMETWKSKCRWELSSRRSWRTLDLDVVLDRVIQHAQNEAMNEFLAGASRCDVVGGDVEAGSPSLSVWGKPKGCTDR